MPRNGFLCKVIYSTMVKDSLHCSLHKALTIIFSFYVSMFNVSASRQSDLFGITSSNYSRHSIINTSNYELNERVWQDLAIVTIELFMFQNDLESLENQNSILTLVLFESFTQTAASDFVSGISDVHTKVQFIYFQVLKVNVNFENEFKDICRILISNRDIIDNVVMFLDNTTVIFELFDNVSLTNGLNFTVIRHVTEWIIVSRHFPISQFNESNFLIDFISIIFKEANHVISIAQKSRSENFSVKVEMLIDPVQMFASKQESHTRVRRCVRSLAARKNVRKSGGFFLKSNKSLLSGLRIPVAMISLKTHDLGLSSNKLSNYERFALALLDSLATNLDFTYDIVEARDDGYFGIVDNGSVKGMTGQFFRREVALTTMPMNPISNRRGIMDFVPVQILSDVVYLVYRLPQQTDLVDMTYIRIIQPDFAYVHIAPVLFMLMCRVAARFFGRSQQTPGGFHGNRCYSKSRKLLSLLEHLCGDRTSTSPRHSKRILAASWHVFWFIMWSAYSAYLVTSFVVNRRELTMKSFEDLAENTDFRVGILNSLSAKVLTIQQSKNIHAQAVWKRIETSRKLDPLTLSLNISHHAQRIISGGYAFIDGSGLLVDEYDYYFSNHTDIRYYATTDLNYLFPFFVGIPTEVFYKETLLKMLRNLDENGTLERLKNKHFNMESHKMPDKGKVSEDEKSVSLKRIGLVFFPVFGGILLSAVALFCEEVFHRWMSQRTSKSLS